MLNIIILVSLITLGSIIVIYYNTSKITNIEYIKDIQYLIISIGIWISGEVLYYTSSSIHMIYFWQYFRFIGISFLPLATISLVYKYVFYIIL